MGPLPIKVLRNYAVSRTSAAAASHSTQFITDMYTVVYIYSILNISKMWNKWVRLGVLSGCYVEPRDIMLGRRE